MRILETGNEQGFTLLEVLVIIVLLAVVFGMAYAGLTTGAEKTEVYSIGQLVAGDLQKVRDEALFNKQETIIEFLPDGYHYQIGASDINRSFKKFQFAFTIPEQIEEDKSEEDFVDEADNPGVTAGEEQNEESGEHPGNFVIFKEDGNTEETKFDWQTSHFKGDLTINQNGTVRWRYERK